MADTAYLSSEAAEEERLMLDAIEKWTEQKVKPVAMELEHANEYPIDLVEDMTRLPASAPQSRSTARSSTSSPKGVEVPWAFT